MLRSDAQELANKVVKTKLQGYLDLIFKRIKDNAFKGKYHTSVCFKSVPQGYRLKVIKELEALGYEVSYDQKHRLLKIHWNN